jgi:hypothetical protein
MIDMVINLIANLAANSLRRISVVENTYIFECFNRLDRFHGIFNSPKFVENILFCISNLIKKDERSVSFSSTEIKSLTKVMIRIITSLNMKNFELLKGCLKNFELLIEN